MKNLRLRLNGSNQKLAKKIESLSSSESFASVIRDIIDGMDGRTINKFKPEPMTTLSLGCVLDAERFKKLDDMAKKIGVSKSQLIELVLLEDL